MLTSVRARLSAVLILLTLVAAPVSAGWWDTLFDHSIVPLERVIQSPESFRGNLVTFVVQFHRLGSIENPFFTKFESDWYTNFAVWPESAPIWEKNAYKSDFPFMFVKRGTDLAAAILQAPMYSRWVVTGRVEEVFRGKPWIDVTAVKRLETQIDEPALVHLVKGLMLRDLRRYDAAAAEFRAVDRQEIPENVRVMAIREEGLALHNAGKSDLGVARLEQALSIAPTDKNTEAALIAMRASLGTTTDAPQIISTSSPVTTGTSGQTTEPTPYVIPATEPAPQGEPVVTPVTSGDPVATPMPGQDPVATPVVPPATEPIPTPVVGNEPTPATDPVTPPMPNPGEPEPTPVGGSGNEPVTPPVGNGEPVPPNPNGN